MFAQEISASRFVEFCLGVVVEILTLTHTQTHTILPQNYTNNFFFTPLAVHTRYFSCVAVTIRDWRTSSVLLQSIDLHHHFHCIVYAEES